MPSSHLPVAPPRYVEAYPRLWAAEAWSAHLRRQPYVVWRDQHHQVVGMAEVRWTQRTEFDVDWHMDDMPYLVGGAGRIQVVASLTRPSGSMQRTMVLCPDCGDSHGYLLYADEDWTCKEKMRLANRSACLDEVVRVTEKMSSIEEIIADGRPRGMREAEYQDLRRELAGLDAVLGGRPRRSASSDYRFSVTSEWVSDGGYADHLRQVLA